MLKTDKQISQIQFLKKLQRSTLEVEINNLKHKQEKLSQLINEQNQLIENNKFEHKHYIKKFYSDIKMVSKFNTGTINDFEFGITKYDKNDKKLRDILAELNFDFDNLKEEKNKLEKKMKLLIIKQEKYQYLMDTIKNEENNA